MSETNTQQQNTQKKTLRGTVVSDAMDKTVVVEVKRFIKHPIYKKFYKKSKRIKAHDEQNLFTVGDVVEIQACRPLSKDKSFMVVSTKEAAPAADSNE